MLMSNRLKRLLVLVLFFGFAACVGCREDETPNAASAADSPTDMADDTTSEADSQAKADESRQRFQSVFDEGLPQNLISNRSEMNVSRLRNSAEDATFVPFPSAGLELILPDGFEKSTRFSGAQQPGGDSTLLILTNPFSLERNTESILESAFKAGSSEMLFKKPMRHEDRNAIFYVSREQVGQKSIGKYILAFGDDSFSWIVTAVFRAELEETVGEQLLRSVLNAKISELPRLPPGEDVDFRLTPNRLKVTDGFVDKLVFALDGKFPMHGKMPVFQAIKSPIPDVDDDQETIARKLIRPAVNFELKLISSDRKLTIDGLDGYEFVSLGRDMLSNEPLQIYSVLLFSHDGIYKLHGWCSTNNLESYVTDFRNLAESFQLKERPPGEADQEEDSTSGNSEGDGGGSSDAGETDEPGNDDASID